MKKFYRIALVLMAFCLGACQSGPAIATGIQPTLTSGAQATPINGSPSIEPGLATTSASSAQNYVQNLVVWVPPEFDPASGGQAGELFKSRLETFKSGNPGITITVRIKGTAGQASLLNELSAANLAAAETLPDLIALPYQDVETAALKGLLTTYDGLSSQPDDPDWYGYARQLSRLQGSTFGLPFAGDALVMLYRPALVNKPAGDLDSLLKLNGPIVFSAADSQATFSLALYLGAGGSIVDAQGRPELNSDILAKELAFFLEGSQKGVFPAWTTQIDADNQVWQAYREQRAPAAITWISHYLSSFPPDTTAAPLPSSGLASFTLATGWSWALGNPRIERHALAVKLAEYLVQSDFMAKWTAAAGYLPTRPTALAAWQDQSLQTLLSQVELSAQARPASEILSSLGPVMRDATLQVMKEQTDPNQVAQTAAERLKGH